MKRLAILALAAGAAALACAEIDRSRLIGLGASVLKIEAEREQGGYALGSGVVIAPDRIVTNCHVTRDAKRIDVLRGGARWHAVAQLRDVEHDLCLLQVPGLQANVSAPVAIDRLKPGQPVTALGYTGGLTLQHSAGDVVALHRLDDARVVQSSNWFNSGASGGGLFDENLDLVGILTFRLRGAQQHYFAAPARWLRVMLDAPPDRYLAVSPDRSERLPYWQRSLADQPRFLRAGVMARDHRWAELESLAREWVRADATDPEPWYLLGMALQQTNRMPQARQALECSLALEPEFGAARALLQPTSHEQATGLPALQDATVRHETGAPAPAAPVCTADAATLLTR